MADPLPLADVVATSAAVAAAPARTAKRDLLAQLLRRARSEDVAVVAAYLSGTLPQGRIGLGWRSLPTVPAAPVPTLTVAAVDAAFTQLAATSGPGSTARRAELVTDLYGRATADEQGYLGALLTGNLRQGSLEGPLLAAMAVAYQVPEATLRRGLMYAGRPGPLAQAAATGGTAAVAALRLVVGRAVRPMLAGAAKSVGQAYGEAGDDPATNGQARGDTATNDAAAAGPGPGPPRLVQAKLDGVRIQVHILRAGAAGRADGELDPADSRADRGAAVRVFTRSLDDITDRVPEVLELARALPVASAVLDGEVIALDATGRPQPFQVTGARTASTAPAATLRENTPLTAYLFDLLHLDGRDLVDEPMADRDALLRAIVPAAALVPGVRTGDAAVADAFLAETLAAGHEGVLIKDLASPYAAGRRGSGWVKVKPVRTLDLVVLAVEHGSGRREGWLSNIHLGARDPLTGDFVMVGKTFKGMTDEILRWQTRRFRELQTTTDGYVVLVRPEQVVEIALDGVQTSRRYPGGVALRFARVIRYRDDKTPAEADTLAAVKDLGADRLRAAPTMHSDSD